MVSVLPGLICRTFVPNWLNSPATKERAPSPIEVRSTTEPTPIAMPRIDRKLRSGLSRSASKA